jgi:hypothetical protein
MVQPEKACSICKVTKPLSEFHRRRHYMADGHRSACKACTAEKTKQARTQRPERTDEERIKARVRWQTRKLIEAGELVPQPCEQCGGLDVQAHHPSYEGASAAHTVRWLCPLHHAQEHGVKNWTKQLEMFVERTEGGGTTFRASVGVSVHVPDGLAAD